MVQHSGMNADEIAALRMRNTRLWPDKGDTSSPADVVAWLAAMQAQEFIPAKWSIAQRTTGLDDETLNKAVADGTVLRTHVVRPTWHFVRPEDICWLLQATGARVHALNATYYRKFGVEGEAFNTAKRLLTKALKGGAQLTRKEIGAYLEGHGITASGLHMGYILMRAELERVIISGALSGKQQTYAYFDDRVPPQPELSHEEAVGRLAHVYFTSRGPATVKDFARWSSLTVADAKAGLAQVNNDLREFEAGGRTYWCPPGAPPRVESPVVDLIQGYDEIVMSYSESKDVLHPPSLAMGNPYDAAYLHAILLDGRLVGHWKHTNKGRQVVVETFFYRTLNAAEKAAMDAAAHAFGAYFNAEGVWR